VKCYKFSDVYFVCYSANVMVVGRAVWTGGVISTRYVAIAIVVAIAALHSVPILFFSLGCKSCKST